MEIESPRNFMDYLLLYYLAEVLYVFLLGVFYDVFEVDFYFFLSVWRVFSHSDHEHFAVSLYDLTIVK